jgi:hypothetical protein
VFDGKVTLLGLAQSLESKTIFGFSEISELFVFYGNTVKGLPNLSDSQFAARR